MVEEEVLGKAYDSRLMGRLLTYMRPYWTLVGFSLLFLLFQSGLQVLGPLITKVAIDKYLDPNAHAVPTLLDPLLPRDPWTGLSKLGRVLDFDSAVHLDSEAGSIARAKAAETTDLLNRAGDKLLTAKSGIHRHNRN